jgi:surface protein
MRKLAALGLSAAVVLSLAIAPSAQSAVLSAVKVSKPAAPRVAAISSSPVKKGKVNIKVSIALPTKTGGAKITGSKVWVGAKSCTITQTKTSCTIKGIKNGKALSVHAHTKNKKGFGAKSVAVSYRAGTAAYPAVVVSAPVIPAAPGPPAPGPPAPDPPAPSAPMQLSVTTTSSSRTVDLPLYGITSVDVNWGDGTVDTYTSTNPGPTTHNYTSPGSFDITITGTMAKFGRSDGAPWTGVTLLTSVSSFGTLGITDLSQAFFGASSLVAVPNTLPSSVTNMSRMFQGAIAFNQPLNSWNTSNVTNMSYMFRDASAFNQPLNSWNTSNVTNMRGMFQDAGAFNQSLNSWNTSNVTNMSYMFYGARAFNQPLTTSGNSWNTSNVTDMGGMFQDARAFNQQLNSWDTSNVTNMSSMFEDARAFNQSLNSWDTALVTDMSSMFEGASAFNQPLNSWNTSNVTNMSYMFATATNWSSANVDATLIGWASLTQRAVVRLTIATCRTAASTAAIANLRARPWTITFPSICTGAETN